MDRNYRDHACTGDVEKCERNQQTGHARDVLVAPGGVVSLCAQTKRSPRNKMSTSEFVPEAIDRFLSLVSFTGKVFGVGIDCGLAVRAGDAILQSEPTDAFTHFVAAPSALKVDGPIVDGSHDDLQLRCAKAATPPDRKSSRARSHDFKIGAAGVCRLAVVRRPKQQARERPTLSYPEPTAWSRALARQLDRTPSSAPFEVRFETLAGGECSQSGIRHGRPGYIRRSELCLEAKQSGIAQGSFPTPLRGIGKARGEPSGEAFDLEWVSLR
jgi:hypothetical protein